MRGRGLSGPSPWWAASRHRDRQARLHARARLLSALRRHFDAAGFVEVDTAALQVSPGNETHLHGLATRLRGPGGEARRRFLHTSPEFALKKLLAAGERQVYSLGHVFRDREHGPLHAAEFTLLEWYRTLAPYDAVMADALECLKLAVSVTGTSTLSFRGKRCDPGARAQRLSVAEAFGRHAGIDLLATIAPTGEPDGAALARASKAAGIAFRDDDTWSDLFARILVERVEPHLGLGAPTLLDRYPIPEAALARRAAEDGRVAERFELYACGVELANGFGELTDATEQRRRFEAAMVEKERRYGERYPLDEALLAALPTMPEASGVALGVDRLLMLATGANHIDDVIWTPDDWQT